MRRFSFFPEPAFSKHRRNFCTLYFPELEKSTLMSEKNNRIALWGGLECTVNRVSDEYFNQLERNGHAARDGDLERFAALGICAIRYPLLWERTAPDGLEHIDWHWLDERLSRLRELAITPIAGLIHHGSGPRHTSLIDPGFAEGLAAYAAAIAQRYPWIEYYTPVNEPLTTARFSGLYGLWYPHGRDEHTFVRALLNQCRATVLSMRAIRKVNPCAKLVQTEDLGKNYSTPEMSQLAGFYNERRWLAWDLLCGKIDAGHSLWNYLLAADIDPAELLWFQDNPCPPDIIGVNYYITSERWLDHRFERYPQRYTGMYGGHAHADIEAPRALATPVPGIQPLLHEVWERYRLPVAVTEVHIDSHREDQLRWAVEIWEAARSAQCNGVDMRAVTIWALLGSYDWHCLVTRCEGRYEPGPFDARSQPPRPTALAKLMQELSEQRPLSHPALQGQGWWRRSDRFFCPPVATPTAITSISAECHPRKNRSARPILITGANGTLGSAFVRICKMRDLACVPLTRQDMDFTDTTAIETIIARYQPWAIINAGGYVRVDDAEQEAERCFRENTHGPSALAGACFRHALQFITFSSDLVFDGTQQTPYVESDSVAPLNTYGKSKAEAEREVMAVHPQALVIRTSAFFGPWDGANFLTQSLKTLAAGLPLIAANDMIVSPTYVPDLVNACLDLLVDRETGIWHLTNTEPLSWHDLAQRASTMAAIDNTRLRGCRHAELNYAARRPCYSALASGKGLLLPSLDDALYRYLLTQQIDIAARQPQAAV
jgi:dTDP-4-dehydrorhamnose reductase